MSFQEQAPIRRYLYGLLLIPLMLSLNACTSSQFVTTASAFGTTTKAATAAQRKELEAFEAADTKRTLDRVAASRAVLNLSPGCGTALDGAPIDDCYLVLNETGEPLEAGFHASNIIALGKALEAYADSLIDLSAKAETDAGALSKSVTDLSKAIGKLDVAAAKAGGGKATPQARYDAVASILSTAGNLYFETSRVAALRRIIVAAAPFVENAAEQLSEANEALHFGRQAAAFQKVVVARREYNAAIGSNADGKTVRAKLETLVTETDNYRRGAATVDAFEQLRQAHAELAKLARSGASLEQLAQVMNRLVTAATNLNTAFETLGKT